MTILTVNTFTVNMLNILSYLNLNPKCKKHCELYSVFNHVMEIPINMQAKSISVNHLPSQYIFKPPFLQRKNNTVIGFDITRL